MNLRKLLNLLKARQSTNKQRHQQTKHQGHDRKDNLLPLPQRPQRSQGSLESKSKLQAHLFQSQLQAHKLKSQLQGRKVKSQLQGQKVQQAKTNQHKYCNALEGPEAKSRRKQLMAYKRSREPTGKSFEEGNDKKLLQALAEQFNQDPMALFDIWSQSNGSYSQVQLALTGTNSKRSHHNTMRAWMDDEDLLQPNCKGNRNKCESMKKKLASLGLARKNPDMESDADDNMQYKPLQQDEVSSHSETELKASVSATGNGASDAEALKK